MTEDTQEETQEETQTDTQTETQPDAQPEFDYEAAAKDMGWDPEYNGPGKKTAQEFYERGMEIQPILQKNLEKFRQDNHQLKSQLDRQQKEFKKSIEVLNKHHKQQLEQKLAEIQQQKTQAVADADKERYQQLEEQEKQLRDNAPAEPSNDVPDTMDDPAVQAWAEKNPWINTDPEMAAYAQFYGQFVSRTRPGLPSSTFLEEVEKGVKEKFPDKFRNTRRDAPGVSPPKPQPKKKKEQGWDDLPADAKAAYEEINRMPGVEMSKEKYAKEYFELEDE